jgi:ABC-2 type transport system ATP-binding protein
VTFGGERLTVRFGDTVALRDVTVDALPGAVSMVVGGDGAGKTTLLRALVGLVRPDEGTVRRPAADRLGFLPAGAGSWENLTVRENVEFVGGAYGFDPASAARHAGPFLERAGLSGVGGRLAGDLSGGMRTKLGFVLAAMHEPDLLVLDEPTTGVDPVSRVELWRMISEAVARGATVVMSTTYLDEAERAPTVTLLDRGEVLLAGRPEDMISSIPGDVAVVDRPTEPASAWRVGTAYRQWFPSGVPDGIEAATPGLEDACIVAELGAAVTTGGGSS